MSNKELFKQAIAEAKIIKEAALATAKKSLEESFSPHVQSMFQAKLQELDNEEEFEDDELSIDGILNEENTEDESDDTQEDEETEIENETEDDETQEDELVTDLSVDDLKNIIQDIITSVVSPEETELDSDEEIELDNIDNLEDDELSIEDDEEVSIEDDEDENFDLDEILAELDALEDTSFNESKYKKELKEATNTVKKLTKELNEVNLLNTKLTYLNQIFKSNNLTESQKLKVIDAFDKATNKREIALVYESLTTNLSTKKASTKQNIKESLGFASKAVGITRKNNIIEDSSISRMQILAGIKKS